MTLMRITLDAPYLLFMGDVDDDGNAKTGHGLAFWRLELCAGQMRLPGCAVDMGLPELDVDGAVGKKYTALALHRELEDRGINANFRATGQTGIMIAGEGIPIDAVVADFISGAAEVLSPDTVLAAARVTNPACVCAGISVNTSSMSDVERRDYLAGLGEQSGLPCVDPVATGMAPVADFLQEKC